MWLVHPQVLDAPISELLMKMDSYGFITGGFLSHRATPSHPLVGGCSMNIHNIQLFFG